jgi:hypothetical protein
MGANTNNSDRIAIELVQIASKSWIAHARLDHGRVETGQAAAQVENAIRDAIKKLSFITGLGYNYNPVDFKGRITKLDGRR